MTVDQDILDDVIDSNKAFVISMVTFGARGRYGWKTMEPIIEKNLCDVYGDGRVLERLTSTYLQSKNLDWDERRVLLFWTPRLLHISRLFPFFKTTGVLAAVRVAFDERIEELNGADTSDHEMETVDALVWTAQCVSSSCCMCDAHTLLSHLIKDAPFQDGPVLLVKQCNILELLPRFAIFHAEEKRELDPTESVFTFYY